MEYNQLIKLWDQRIVLLTAILNLTKRMEAQSSEEDIQLGDLPEQRQVYLERLKKCNRVIDECEKKANQEDRERLTRILSGKADAKDCTEQERRLAEYAQNSRCLLDSILASDVEARRKIRNECDRIQKLLRSARKKSGSASGAQHY